MLDILSACSAPVLTALENVALCACLKICPEKYLMTSQRRAGAKAPETRLPWGLVQTRADIAASFQRVAVQHLLDRCRRGVAWARDHHPDLKRYMRLHLLHINHAVVQVPAVVLPWLQLPATASCPSTLLQEDVSALTYPNWSLTLRAIKLLKSSG